MIARASLFVGALLLAGCGSTEVHQILLRQPSGSPRRHVELYVVGRPPQRPFYEVGLVQVIGHGTDADVADVTNAIERRAGELGCDAVIGIHVELGSTRAHATGICVNWYEVAPPQQPKGSPEPIPSAAPTPAPTAPETPAPTDATSI
ncbi:MAG TPA: hypothetical protein VF407_25375 [Polyangiaceae bacterium]